MRVSSGFVVMGDDSNLGTSRTSQAEIKKVVEEALKGFPGFSTLLEAAGKLTQPVEDDKPSEREDNSTKLGGKSRILCRLYAPYHQTRGENGSSQEYQRWCLVNCHTRLMVQ